MKLLHPKTISISEIFFGRNHRPRSSTRRKYSDYISQQKPEPENMSMSVKSFYRRALPSHLIPFHCDEGKQLFKESLHDNMANAYFQLAGNFTAQSDPSFCGPGSLAMVLNALETDPLRTWKGVWRW